MTFTLSPACPHCGSPLTEAQRPVPWFLPSTGCIETRLENRPVAACTGCEFVLDLSVAVAAGLKRIA